MRKRGKGVTLFRFRLHFGACTSSGGYRRYVARASKNSAPSVGPYRHSEIGSPIITQTPPANLGSGLAEVEGNVFVVTTALLVAPADLEKVRENARLGEEVPDV